MRHTDFVAYCGRFCGSCAICESNVVFGIQLIQSINAEFGPSKAASELGWAPMRHLAETAAGMFDAAVNGLAPFTRGTFPQGCLFRCVPPCEIAACVQERSHRTCADCKDVAQCTRLDEHREALIGNLTFIKEHGIEQYAEEQARRVADGRRARIEAAIRQAEGGASPGDPE